MLSLLAGPLCAPVLKAHLDEPLRLLELQERITAAQATLRGQVDTLRRIGALERRVRGGMPYTVENELTPAGHAVLAVAEAIEAWLARAPQGPIALGSESAKGALRALIGGWNSAILSTLAVGSRSLTELDMQIPSTSYPSLERRFSAMRDARQVELETVEGGAKRYAVTEWTRTAVVPLATASRCECRHLSDVTSPPSRTDIEAAFLLAVPMAELPVSYGGSCLFAVNTTQPVANHASGPLAGVDIQVDRGKVTSCVPRLSRDPATWALGTAEDWLDAIVEGHHGQLRFGGDDTALAVSLTERLCANHAGSSP